MNDAALLDSLHAALRNPDLAWYTEFHAGESIVAGYLDSLTDPYDDDAIQVPEGWFRYSVVTREGDHALPWMEHWNEYEYSITHHIDWNGKGFTPYDLYCTQDLTGMIADGSLASIREDARTIFKDRPLTDDYLFANSIWPELADVYSYFGSAGIPIMTIWQNPDQGRAAFGETNFGSLFNNANITVYLGGIKDAKFLGEISQLVGQREIVRGSVNIDGTGRRSVNNSIQKENILDVSDLTEWPVGRALLLASQSRAQIVKTLPWTGNRQWADALAQAKAKAREEQRKAA